MLCWLASGEHEAVQVETLQLFNLRLADEICVFVEKYGGATYENTSSRPP